MAVFNPQAFSGSLEGGLRPLYLLHGEEDLLRLEALDLLRAAARRYGYLNREVLTLEARFDPAEWVSATQSAGLFAELKLLEIHIPGGKPGKEGGEALQQLAADLPPDTSVVVVLPKLEKAQQQSKWFAALAAQAVVVEAAAVSAAALPQWIRVRLPA